MSIGQSLPIRDAEAKVRGTLSYSADFMLPGMLHAALLLSPHPHAVLEHIDARDASALEGVLDIIWHEHVPAIKYNSAMRFHGHEVPENELIFDKIVRCIGDRVAAVAAESREAARRAVGLINVSYKQLPACLTISEALQADTTAIHPEGNVLPTIEHQTGDVDAALMTADHVFEATYTTPPIHHWALENHCYTAKWEGDKLTVWSSTQNSFAVRLLLAKLFSLPLHRVRVIKPPLGGAFGGKLSMIHEPVVAALSLRTGRPVRLELSRTESMISTATRHAAAVTLRTGVMDDGRLVAQDIRLLANTGAYCGAALNVVGAVSHKVFKLYKTPAIRFSGTPVYTNLPSAGAMRGYGSPQVLFAIEVQLREIAEHLGMDPVELHLRNLVESNAKDPFSGRSLGNPRPLDCVRKGSAMFSWPDVIVPAKAGVVQADGRLRGVGMAVGLHGNGVYGAHRDFTALTVKLNEDATAVLYTGTHDMGNGSVTIQVMILAQELGIRPQDIECVETDTELVPWNLGDFASRGVFVSGEAARQLGRKAASRLVEHAAAMLDRDASTLDLKDCAVVCRQSSQALVPLADLLAWVQSHRQEELTISISYASLAGRSSYGAHFAQVAIDPSTGEVEVERYCAVHDAGTVLNPAGIEGQLEGGIHMGIGYALCEGLSFDSVGHCTNATASKYRLIKASQMPHDLMTAFIDSCDDPGPYGAKSIGECAVVPVAPAVVNAVANALGHNFRSIPLCEGTGNRLSFLIKPEKGYPSAK